MCGIGIFNIETNVRDDSKKNKYISESSKLATSCIIRETFLTWAEIQKTVG